MFRVRSQSPDIVYPTTNSDYGIGEKEWFCTKETPLKPISLYGATKSDAETETLDAGSLVTLRLATGFGTSPCIRTDLLVDDFVHGAVTDRAVVLFEGHFKRNFIYIRDVTRIYARGGKIQSGTRNL